MNKYGYGSRHEDRDKIIFSAPRPGDPNEEPPRPEEIYVSKPDEDK